jgi:TRAP-type C4-dicarboxylate transport system permease small subunit
MPFVAWLKRALAGAVALVLFAMMLLTVVDVVGRYVLHRPVAGSFELMQFMLAVLVFTALPLVTVDRAHITVSLFESTGGWPGRALRLFVLALSAMALALIAGRMWKQGDLLRETQAITGYLFWPIAPIAYFASALSALALVLLLAEGSGWKRR